MRMPKDIHVYVALGLILSFILLNYDPDIGLYYLAFLTVGFFAKSLRMKHDFPLSTSKFNAFTTIGIPVIAFAGFLFIASMMSGAVSQALTGPQSVLTYQAQFVPILKEAPALRFISYGLLIPIVETMFFFGIIYAWFGNIFKVRLDRWDIRNAVAIVLVMTLFAFFHITSKNGDTVLLIISWVFAAISLVLVKYYGELKQAVVLHVVNNALVMLIILGVLS